jgi:Acyl-CoA synthetases (AMP-forming)/AMP-acid ligases II
MGKELQAVMRKKSGRRKAQVCQFWGLREISGTVTILPLAAGQDDTGSVGSLVNGTETQIVKEDGKDVECPGRSRRRS